jgi:putative nucleotidyltransferase with HDIG domain
MNIKKILISQAVPGMIVAADIFTTDNHLIISKGTTLTDKVITRLEFYSIIDLSVYHLTAAIDNTIEDNSTTYYEKIKKSESFHRFHLAYTNTVNNFKESLDHIATHKDEINLDDLLAEMHRMLNQGDSNIELLNMLHCMRNYDDTTYVHSMNVAIICNIMGKWLNFTPEDLEVITLCGLLHDIGKLMVPYDLITKPGKLTDTEFSTVKAHTIRGYNLIKAKKIDARIKHAVLMHHERCDGSGYPYGFYNEQIDPFAKLVAIADVYDAMTSARVYRGPLCPFEVISIFETEGYSKYDPTYIMTFLSGIVQTYVNNTVKLSDGQTGNIIMINKMELARPIIRVADKYIDLSRNHTLQIVELL